MPEPKTDDVWLPSHRYDQCDVTCTTDCGHCKGDPVGALRRDLHALARRLAARFEESAGLREALEAARVEQNQMADNATRLHGEDRAEMLAIEDRLDAVRRKRNGLRRIAELAGNWRRYMGDDLIFDAERALAAAVDSYTRASFEAAAGEALVASSKVETLLGNHIADAGPGPRAHNYLSTACFHGHHDRCGVKQAERGETGPPHCKFCPAPCRCACHEEATDGD